MTTAPSPAGWLELQGGALLIDKPAGISSFGVIEVLQRQAQESWQLKRRDLPKLGHGGTLDPFATGLLAVCTGRAVKLARYFLGATKEYEGVIRFGQTTVPGDPTAPVSESGGRIPESLEELRALALSLQSQPYLQTPPMHSAKKKDGKPLYELARQGIEVDREAKLCHLYRFEILSYEAPLARFRVSCSSGTYIRTLAQDFARLLGTLGMLDSLRRTGAGAFRIEKSWTPEQVGQALKEGKRWHELPCFLPFDELLEGYDRAEASAEEARALSQGRQNVLFNILRRAQAAPARARDLPPVAQESCVAIYTGPSLVAVARREGETWGLERVFC